MRVIEKNDLPLSTPRFINESRELATYIKSLDATTLSKSMHLSSNLADKTLKLMQNWDSASSKQSAAIKSFIGDIYSGLQVSKFSNQDLQYANTRLVILSGLYGALRPLDGIYPYRLEMGYRFPDPKFKNLYNFWGDKIAKSIPTKELIINTSSAEYTKGVFPYLAKNKVITPRFLTVNPKTKQPTFVVVHAKIARGAFARWIILNKVETDDRIKDFNDIGYSYVSELSTELEPVYVAKEFGGIGLSMRLNKD